MFLATDTDDAEADILGRGYISLVIQEFLRWRPSPPRPLLPSDDLLPLDCVFDWGARLPKEPLCINASCHDLGLSYFYETWSAFFRGFWTGTLLEPEGWTISESRQDDFLPLNSECSKANLAEDIVRAPLLLRFNKHTQYSARDKSRQAISTLYHQHISPPHPSTILTHKRNNASLRFLVRRSESLLAMEAES